MNFDKDYYQILEVSEGAPLEEIRKRRRLLSKIYHDDKSKFESPEEKAYAEERMKSINKAYEILGDKKKREAYDHYRRIKNANSGASTNSPPPPTSKPPKLVVSPKSLNFGVLPIGERRAKRFKVDNRGGLAKDGKIGFLFSEADAWFRIPKIPKSTAFPFEVEVIAETLDLAPGQRYEGWIEILFASTTATVDLLLVTKEEDTMQEEIVVKWDPPQAANADFFYDLKPGEKIQADLWIIPKFPGAGDFNVRVAGPLPSWIKVTPMACTPPARLTVEVEAPQDWMKDKDEWIGKIDLEILLDD